VVLAVRDRWGPAVGSTNLMPRLNCGNAPESKGSRTTGTIGARQVRLAVGAPQHGVDSVFEATVGPAKNYLATAFVA
jgi:hypothetical protein